VYPIKDDIKFRLVQFRSGLKIPIFGSELEIYGIRQWYRAFINQVLSTENIEAGFAYDYFKGWSISSHWEIDLVKKSLDKNINPAKGFSLSTSIDFEKNDFIEGLNLSESGTLTGEYKDNDLIRFQLASKYHYRLPIFESLTFNIGSSISYINNDNVDSFFHTYLGGMPGLKGYPFYSIQGTKSTILDLSIRTPIFKEKHHKFNWAIFQNSTIAGIFQIGDAWRGRDISFDTFKRSLGIQWRLNGFSFYNYPTAIEVEFHQPLDKFTLSINDNIISYGEEGRTYVKILFDF